MLGTKDDNDLNNHRILGYILTKGFRSFFDQVDLKSKDPSDLYVKFLN